MKKGPRAAPDLTQGSYNLFKEGQDGELSSQPVFLFAPNKKRFTSELGGWFITWQETTMVLASSKELTLTDWRVMAVLQAKLDFDNWIRMTHAEIGEHIDVARPNVSTSMKRLTRLQVVLLGPSARGVRTYRLNPELLFKGTLWNAAKARREAPKFRVIDGGALDGGRA